MFKKLISYLIIVSLFWLDLAWAVKDFGGSSDEDLRPSSPSLSPRKLNKNLNESPSFTILPSASHISHNPSFLDSSDDNDNAPLLKEENDEHTPLLKDPSEESALLKKGSIQTDPIPSSDPSDLRSNFVQLSSDDESSRDMSLKTLNEWVSQEEFDIDETLKIILPIENRPFFLKWAQVDHTVDKVLYALWLRKKDVTGSHWKEWCNSPPLWVEGQGVPLNTGFSFARAMTGFHQGVDYFTKQALSLSLWGLIGYQIYELEGFYPLKALRIFVEGNEKSVRGILSLFVEPAYSYYFFSIFAAPILYGLGNAAFFARKGLRDTPESFVETMKKVKDFSDLKNRAGLKGFWNDKLRWIFPYPEMGGATTYLVTRLLLDGTLTKEEREAALHILISFTQNTTGWSKIIGLDALQKLAIGTSLKQLKMVKEAYGKDYYETLVKEKAQALEALRQENPGIRQAGFTGSLHNLYAHYLRWEMGDFDNKASALAWGVYKAVTVGLTINFLIQVAKQIAGYLSCPKPLERGFNYAMRPSGYSLYNQKCYEAYLSTFNKVPGQPACTLVNLFPKFKLAPNYTLFNLSGAGATGEQVAELIMGLRKYQPHIHLTQFDLSGNVINTESGMKDLFNAFKNVIMTNPPDKGINFLDLSGNLMGYDRGTQVLGQGLQFLPRLQTLDLSNNQIGYHGDKGRIAIGEGLKFLSQLRVLNLSGNVILSDEGNGTTAIVESLKYLPQLQNLDLSNNQIGDSGAKGIIAIGEGLKYLSNLQLLDLSNNQIGMYGRDDETIAIGKGLSSLINLQFLDLSNNAIGLEGDKGTISIGKGLGYLSNLRYLDFSGNVIKSGFSTLVSSITSLKTLESLYIQQRTGEPIPASQRNQLQQFWKHRNNQTDVYALVTVQDVQDYLNSLSNTTHTIPLSRNFPNPSVELVTLLFKGFSRFSNLQILDLSNNAIGYNGTDGANAIGENLKYLPHLQALDLSNNCIGGIDDNGTISIGNGLQYLPQLQTLNLSNNLIGVVGAVAIGENLKYLLHLQTLDLSRNVIGNYDDNGTIAIGESFKYLSNLQALDLSQNWIGNGGDNGTIAIGESLKHLLQLKILNLSDNYIGEYGNEGIIAIGKGISKLSQLQASNHSGSHLQTLDLSNNYIYIDGALPQNLLNALPQVICHGLKTLNIQGQDFTNIPWSQAANALEGLYSVQIQKVCEANRCFGTPIHDVNVTEIQCKAVQNPDNGLLTDICIPASSSASSLSPPAIFKAFSNGELVGSVALLFLIGSNLSPLVLKVKDAISPWFDEEETTTRVKTKAKSSWAYVYNNFLLLIWLSFMSLFLSDA